MYNPACRYTVHVNAWALSQHRIYPEAVCYTALHLCHTLRYAATYMYMYVLHICAALQYATSWISVYNMLLT